MFLKSIYFCFIFEKYSTYCIKRTILHASLNYKYLLNNLIPKNNSKYIIQNKVDY